MTGRDLAAPLAVPTAAVAAALLTDPLLGPAAVLSLIAGALLVERLGLPGLDR